ncbi:hypothetical protein [Legionella micdadei]|uniref:Uncharacterized protein n=1 Tax=Legionella micdadei TaxID=451 RepID=A0A098GEE5_LEGMI|nr:hypothetical protein [Legionella micdadei]ARG98022.1 hypothetical protein B6N58_10315 [Legionella micdadei]ARH00818.1 hypothetical protein B6V88_10535 [Legionella micdadei]KTD30155.1 hypothetical protein Lmic_0336 [Legionella micdadei]NSL18470.1 hypothetical protein [Legionella micdadei]CEG60350.1 protein of unknown function [Legionella micdadei]
MFKRLSNWYESLVSDPSSEPKPTSQYSSQDEMLRAVGRDDEAGLCNPLTNIYAKKQIAGSNPRENFSSETNVDVYLKAVEEEDHQQKLREEGKDGKHSAFVDTQTPYQVKTFPAGKEIELDEVLPTQGHAIITYPVEGKDGGDDYHQVYLGRRLPSGEGKSECISFDSSRKGGGVKEGSCNELLKEFLENVSTRPELNRPSKKVTVATTSSTLFHRKDRKIQDEQVDDKPLFEHK